MMKRKTNVRTLVMLSVLIAMEIILSRFFSIAAWNIKIGLSFIPVVFAAVAYGPLAGGLVGGLADVVGAMLFPIGAYFPGFTLTAILTGVVYGMFLHKRQTVVRVVGAVAVNQLILSLLLNTLWIAILYGSGFGAVLMTRIVQCIIMLPVQFVIIGSMTKVLKVYMAKRVEG